MPSTRYFALFATLAVFISPSLFAGQATGQLPISMTIAKHCEVVGERQGDALSFAGRGCEADSFQLRDEQDRLLPAQLGATAASLQIKRDEVDGSRVVVYW